MSVKRSGEEVSSSSVSKIIKLGDTLEILDDVDVAEWKIKDDGSIKMHMTYDSMYEEFFVAITKSDAQQEKKIILDMNCLSRLYGHLGKITLLNQRYSKSGKMVTFTFDVGQDVWLTLDNKFSGSMSLDIRKHYSFGKS